MRNPPLVFVDIDTQRDFLDPEGALFVPGSMEILGNLARLTAFAAQHGIHVLATACSHTSDDPEMAVFGLHCMAGTTGQERVAATSWQGDERRVIGVSEGFEASGAIPSHLTIEKREYDVFSHPEAEAIVARYNEEKPTFIVYGVATDYCVKAAVLGLLQRGCNVVVVVDAIRAIDADGEPEVLAEFTRQGALLTITDVVCDD